MPCVEALATNLSMLYLLKRIEPKCDVYLVCINKEGSGQVLKVFFKLKCSKAEREEVHDPTG